MINIRKYSCKFFGLSHISDMVNGVLNKIKTNRTPTKATQTDSLGTYHGQMRSCCLSYSMTICIAYETMSFLLFKQ